MRTWILIKTQPKLATTFRLKNWSTGATARKTKVFVCHLFIGQNVYSESVALALGSVLVDFELMIKTLDECKFQHHINLWIKLTHVLSQKIRFCPFCFRLLKQFAGMNILTVCVLTQLSCFHATHGKCVSQ